jgi:CheY-like chemotaxis protein
MLERLRCEVVAAVDGRSALDLFEPNGFQIVLLDLRLPDLDGCEVARRMREREAAASARRTPIVAQTANTSPADIAAVAAAGMDAFLPKPIHLKNLSETLDRFTRRPVGGTKSDKSL